MLIKGRDLRHIDLLLKSLEDRTNLAGYQKLAACLVIQNRIIAFGENKTKSHPFQKRFGMNDLAIYPHAEVDCINNALKRIDRSELGRATLYVARLKKSSPKGKYIQGLARPCSGCQEAIRKFQINRVVFTTDKGVEVL